MTRRPSDVLYLTEGDQRWSMHGVPLFDVAAEKGV
jgi:hypothetical protein